MKQATLKELLYAFGRCTVFCEDVSETQSIPHWNIFQSETSDSHHSVSNISYNPIIMATPTDYNTVYTTILRTKEVVNALGQSYVPTVIDMSFCEKIIQASSADQD
jgi:hypothetical protein